jgi:hypothetical protein
VSDSIIEPSVAEAAHRYDLVLEKLTTVRKEGVYRSLIPMKTVKQRAEEKINPAAEAALHTVKKK